MCAKKVDESSQTLREMLDKFEQVVAWFSSDDLDVETALAKYEEGAKLAEKIRAKLVKEKNKIEIIQKNFANAEIDSRDESENDEVGAE